MSNNQKPMNDDRFNRVLSCAEALEATSDPLDSLWIAILNDEARSSIGNGSTLCKVVLTQGVAALNHQDVNDIIKQVREFDDFDETNDPCGEHGFGAFDFMGKRIFWKIDCYDKNMEYGSPDPGDRALTKRVLTIMFADEY